MRQAGILAAAGIVALEEIVPNLKKDHLLAQKLAAGLARIPGVILSKEKPPSNMVYLSLAETIPLDAGEVAQILKESGILVGALNSRQFRLVIHYWINEAAVEKTIRTFEEILSGYT